MILPSNPKVITLIPNESLTAGPDPRSNMSTAPQAEAKERRLPPQVWRRVALSAVPGIVFLLTAYRITIGVDLRDESYYISFIDGWLKTGIQAGSARVLHQT